MQSPLDNQARLIYVYRGKSKIISSTDLIHINGGDMLLMRCGQFVNHWLENNEEEPYEVIAFQLLPNVLQDVYNNELPIELQSLKNEVEVPPLIKISSNKTIDHFFEGLRFNIENKKLMTDEYLKIKVRELISILISIDTSEFNFFLGQLFQSKAYQFQEVINKNLFENLKLEDFAFLSGMSLSTFQRKFKEIYNMTPKKYIVGKRLEKAEGLLKTTSLRISDIAYDCGFEDIAHFSKSFSAMYKSSPRDYRNSID
ncbi:helix-turn-helix domain-containing protein [Flammeovirga agarivorans]|uniref:Helix-turn-helix transcriptional regulator n=1 Tax=Flammeovirga agarivorans TaxID=2726742 RepID=A0A7X8SQI7_9BACT|nr:helix-turn-helix domain-containing protein [Flammeovirga agarivorans]NLR94557.1 helix-turn-helix transcriptional regulator [Flammeovirga agarivorans]